MPIKLTTKKFINKARKKHGDKYNYSRSNYITNNIKIIIICKKHGEFEQRPANHLNGQRCPKCNLEKRTKTTQEFIKKAKQIHGNKYDYSKVKYKNDKIKVIIICKKHREFKQRAGSHINQKQRCPKCIGNQKKTTKEFIKKARGVHNNKYDYSKVKYKSSHIKIIILCKEHGEFEQIPNSHLKKCGCPKCFGNKKLTTQEFIKKAKQIHGNKYNYLKVKYKNSHIKIIILCKKHGEFKQIPTHHLNGHGCQRCSYKVSKSSNKWLNKIEKKLGYKLEKEYKIIINNKVFFNDGYDKNTNTCYEYNGYFWHGHPDYYNPNDFHPIKKISYDELYQKTLEKERLIRQAGYNLIIKWGN